MEDLAKVVTECTYASEFRYRNPIVEEGTVVVAISQSRRDRRHARGPARGARRRARWRWAW